MLVTFHAICYVITELSRPAWQKDLRDITFFIIEAMKDNDIFGQEKTTLKQTTVYLPEEVLNQLRQMNPRDVANIIVN